MKNNIILCLTVLSILNVCTSCEDYLSVEPESTLQIENFYSNAIEADIALAGIYSRLADQNAYGGEMSVIMESGTDEGYYNSRFNENWTVGLYRHTSADIYVQDLWTTLYTVVNLSNLFIENMNINNFDNQENFNRLIGEARFLRAHAYSLLVNWYEEVPMPLTSTKDQSANNLAVSTLEELYDQIISDYTFAAENLADKGDPDFTPGRATKLAANGLLARVYLKMAGYPLKDASKYALAKEQCEIVIQSGKYNLNSSASMIVTDDNGQDKIIVTRDGYRDHFLSYIQNNYDTQESIFEISYRNLRETGLFVESRIGDFNGVLFQFGGGAPGLPASFAPFVTTPVLRNSYRTANDSIRQAWNIAGYFYTGNGDVREVTNPLTRQYNPGKYRRWEPSSTNDFNSSPPPGTQEPYTLLEAGTVQRYATNLNFPVLRYADILLMYAEAENELNGPTASAIQYLDEVRTRAGLASIMEQPQKIGDKMSFFNEIVDERFRELCFEGLRKHDLIRWELLGDKLEFLKETIQGDPNYNPNSADQQAFLRPSRFFDVTKHLSLPYPLQEVQLNNQLEQKPEWQ